MVLFLLFGLVWGYFSRFFNCLNVVDFCIAFKLKECASAECAKSAHFLNKKQETWDNLMSTVLCHCHYNTRNSQAPSLYPATIFLMILVFCFNLLILIFFPFGFWLSTFFICRFCRLFNYHHIYPFTRRLIPLLLVHLLFFKLFFVRKILISTLTHKEIRAIFFLLKWTNKWTL